MEATDRAAVRETLDKVRAEGRDALTAPEGKRIADAYGIPTPREGLATTADEAAALAEDIGQPVACKIVSQDILHKTEAGGVIVGVEGPAAVREAFAKILANAKAYNESAAIDGVQIQQM
ncbi:MAG: CoA-binding protein, partial [Alphaproteobacteria bacterium]|nr:CoA-binding protein [Alphaproteobacteria bacterium]